MEIGSLSARRAVLASMLFCAALLITALFPARHAAAADITGPYARQVQQMYVAYYGRPGDPAGVEYWAGRLEDVGGNWISDLVNAFGTSAEYTERFGGLSNEALIDNLYQQLFNRTAEPAGRSFYIDLLGGSNVSGLNPSLRQSTLAQIALDIANGARLVDSRILEHKISVSVYFTQKVNDSGRSYETDDIPFAVQLLSRVDETSASVDQAISSVDEFVATNPVIVALNQLRGNWQFVYKIISTWVDVYYLQGEIFEFEGSYFLEGSDEFGNLALATWAPELGYMLYAESEILVQAYVFNFTGLNTVAGCYFQNDDFSNCFPLTGTRVATAISRFSAGDVHERIQFQLQESGAVKAAAQSHYSMGSRKVAELDSLLLNGYPMHDINSETAVDRRLFESFFDALRRAAMVNFD